MGWFSNLFGGKQEEPKEEYKKTTLGYEHGQHPAQLEERRREDEARQLQEMAALEEARITERVARINAEPKIAVEPLPELGNVTGDEYDPEGQAEADRLVREFVREANAKKAREGRPPSESGRKSRR